MATRCADEMVWTESLELCVEESTTKMLVRS
jgi:hypothetical protein